MKKETKIILSLATLISLVLLITIFTGIISAQDTQPSYPLGINPDKIQELPQTPEELANASTSYLKTGWGKILSEIPGIKTFHEFLKAHPMIFIILFNEQYNVSWVFFSILIIWLYLMAITADLVNAGFNAKFGIVAGIGLSILLSQLGIIKAIVVFVINLIFSQSLWWVRLILGIIIILILMLGYYGSSVGAGAIRAAQKRSKEEELEQEAKEGRAFREGAKEAQKLTKPIRDMKKKFPMS
jgi:hypothetical protein